MSTEQRESDLKNLLAALVEQARSLALRLAGDADQVTSCHFCGGPLPLWENILVLHITGVAAHVECPQETLAARLKSVGPGKKFPYEAFSRVVEERMKTESPTACSGEIVI